MAMGGSTVQTTCGCGTIVAKKGYDDKGRMRYRSQCYQCWYLARKFRKDYCEWCFVKADENNSLEIDHIDGDRSNNHINNLQTLCNQCHINKTKIFKDNAYNKKERKAVSQTKYCRKCSTEKNRTEFYKSVRANDGLQKWCKPCQNAEDKRQRETRKDSPATKTRTSKTCNICKETKPVSQFGKKSQSADKLMNYCKPCWRKYVTQKKKNMLK